MTALAGLECERLAEMAKDGRLTVIDAITRAYHLGAEFERLDAMQRACEDYSRARSAREEAFARVMRPSQRPSG